MTHWVGTWTATPAPADGVALSSPTIRMFPRISIGGDTIRVRLSNAAGISDLIVGATHVAKRGAGAGIRSGTDRTVMFNGAGFRLKFRRGRSDQRSGGPDASRPLEDLLAVSIHLPAEIPARASLVSNGRYARQFNCFRRRRAILPAWSSSPPAALIDDWFFLCGIDDVINQRRCLEGSSRFGDLDYGRQ